MSSQIKSKRKKSISNLSKKVSAQPSVDIFSKKKILFSFMIIIFSGIAVYASSLKGEFLFDDDFVVKTDSSIDTKSNHAISFSGFFDQNKDLTGKTYYRPLQTFSYAVDRFLWGFDVRGYHGTSIGFHILAALSVYLLTLLLFENSLLSFLAGLFFVVHPIHSEAVCYISGRADPLALFFMLAAFIMYVQHTRTRRVSFLCLAVLSYFAALLSRESSLILPVLLILYHVTFKEKIRPGGILSLLIAVFLYLVVRLKFSGGFTNYTPHEFTIAERIPAFFVAVANYFRLLFLPFNLHMEYMSQRFSYAHMKSLYGIFISGALLIYAFRCRKNNKIVFFSILWFFTALMPPANFFTGDYYMAEHWLYLPSIGFFILLSNFFVQLSKTQSIRFLVVCGISGLIGFYSFLTVRQCAYWKEPITFYKKTLEAAPDSFRAYNNLGLEYHRLGKDAEAIPLFQKAIELNPTYAEALSNLGLEYHHIGREDLAISSFKKALEIKADYAPAFLNLGNSYNYVGKYTEAVEAYQQAIALKPNYAEAMANLGSTYSMMGEANKAIEIYRKAAKTSPSFAGAYEKLAKAYSKKNDDD